MPTTGDAPPLVTATRLRERKDRIIALWVARTKARLDAARSKDPPEIVDSIPHVLDHLADSLAKNVRKSEVAENENTFGAQHGHQRAEVTAYSLEALITEHQLLHEVLLEVLDEGGPIDKASRDLIAHATLVAIRNASCEFARIRGEATHSELRQTDTRFRHMVDAVKDYAIFTINPDGVITTWNVGCVRMKRFPPEEAIGKHFSMLYPKEGNLRDEPMSHLRTAATEGRFRGEGVRLRKGGDLFLADASITPIYEGGNIIGFTKVVQDLTERNLIMQERDLSRSDSERLKSEAEYRERFVAALTHDLRTPLAAARAGAELLLNKPDDADRVRTVTPKIAASLARADRMIADLLDTSRIHAQEQLSLSFEHCDVKEIALEILEELTNRHGDRFQIDVQGETRGFWGPDGLRRVLDNLLSNAVKYGERNTPITVRLRRVEGRMLIAVHNHGTIIPIEEQENVFRAFHRAPTAQRSGQPGWGIGLTLVKGIAEAHGGIVKAESYPKEGTTFTVDLPVDGQAAVRQQTPQSL